MFIHSAQVESKSCGRHREMEVEARSPTAGNNMMVQQLEGGPMKHT